MIHGIDKDFYELLNDKDKWLSSIKFPKGIETNLFKIYAEKIYRINERIENEILLNPEDRYDYKKRCVTDKSAITECFMDDLLKSCFSVGEKWRYKLMSPDYVASTVSEIKRFLRRDHILHSGYVFLWGLWLYKNFNTLQTLHEDTLKRKPECIAYKLPNADIRWQFLRQWVITSFFHDVGYFFELGKPVKEIYHDDNLRKELIKRYRDVALMNIYEQWWLKKMMISDYIIPSHSRINYDLIWGNLDIELYEIIYPPDRGEEDIPNNMWHKCLEDINEFEIKLGKFNHGVYSAKVLLKLGNFSIKLMEITDQRNTDNKSKEPWKRNSYRNFILPAYAILKHDADTSGQKNIIKDKIEKEINNLRNRGKADIQISYEIFSRDDFLTLLLIMCDELAEFDRIGGKSKSLLFGMDYEIKLPKLNGNDIEFSIEERK